MSRLLPFPWYGGKYNHLNWITDNLPQTKQYVEPFGGSGVVLLNKEESAVETFNDLDGEVINFFKVLQENEDELLRRLEYTPHSREMFQEAVETRPNDNIKRAVHFLVRTAQAYNGVQGGSWASSITVERRNMPQRTSAWKGRVEQVEKTAKRMSEVQIENRPAIDLIERHDDENVLFYCDPPYPPEARTSTGQYNFEMEEKDHRELASALSDIEGYAAVSSYECDLMDELYSDWSLISDEEKTLAGKGTGDRREVMYINYPPSEVQ